MKKQAFLFALLLAITFNSCKKSSTAPSIVGTWKIANISGTYATRSYPAAALNTITYSYSNPVLTENDTSSNTLITVNGEVWVFNSDGTFTINENYQLNSTTVTTTPTVNTITGWWDYTSSNTPNSTIVLRTYSTPSILPVGGAFFIQSVSSTQLVLTVDESMASTTGSSVTKNFTLTFSH